MSFDTFAGLPLNQSIAGATWDSGDVTWHATYTILVGDGANGVRTPTATGGLFVHGCYEGLSAHAGQAVFFKPLAGRNTTSWAISLVIHGAAASQYSNNSVTARVGAYGVMELRDLAANVAVEIASPMTDGNEYCMEVYRTTNANGKEYVAKLYNASGGVRGTLVSTTPLLTLATALPAGSKTAQIVAGDNNPNFALTRVESVDAAVADTTAPTLSGPTSSATGSTTGSGSVTTNEANGTLYHITSTSNTATVTAVKAGGSQAVTSAGSKNVTVSGLTASTVYYLHFVHTDAAGNDSAVATSASFTTNASGDVTAPVLSAPTATATTSSTATGTVATDEGGGTLYYLANASATDTVANIKAGGGTQAVSATGTRTVSLTGLTPGATYYLHFVHTDAAGNNSNVANTTAFTTPAADTTAPTFAGGSVITPGAITASSLAGSYPAATDNVAVIGYQISKDSGANWVDNGTGLNFSFTGLTASTTYPVWVRAYDNGATRNYSTPLQLSMTTSASPTGSFTTDEMESSGTLRISQACNWTWFAGGVIGTTTGTATHGSGTTTAGAKVVASGIPLGTGYIMVKFADGGVAYQTGTVA